MGTSFQFVAPLPKPPDYDHEVIAPLRLAQKLAQEQARKEELRLQALKADCDAQDGALEAETCVLPPPPLPEPPAVSQSVSEVVYTVGELVGSFGYALAGGNCVNEPGVNNPGWGNPIEWPVTSQTPWIGASVLFYFNHVAVVTGVWSNGDVEIRHQNCPNCPTRYPRSMIRGFR